jgi:hypothetical protein
MPYFHSSQIKYNVRACMGDMRCGYRASVGISGEKYTGERRIILG